MANHGLAPRTTAIIADGKLHRFDVEGDKKGSNNGYYVLHLDDRPAGMFGSWKTGVRETWKANGAALSDFEREKLLRDIRKAEQRRAREEERKQAEAAGIAEALWDSYGPAPADHPYLKRKDVKPHCARIDGDGRLVLPLRDFAGKLWSLETIDVDGHKLYLPGGRKKGCYCWLGDPGKSIVIAEGFATAASIQESTGLRVAVGFDAGNLPPVAQAIREGMPDAYLVVAADNDCETEGNPGVREARKAADAANATVAIPEWPDPSERKLDFNDLCLAHGLERVANLIFDAFDAAAGSHESTEHVERTESADGTDERSTIRMFGGSLDQNSNEAELILGAHARAFPFEGIYRLGLTLVRPIRLESDRQEKNIQKPAGSLVLSPTTANFIRRRLTRLANFLKFDKRSDDWIKTDCSDTLAKSIMEGAPWDPIPPLLGVVETPTLREDGSLLTRPGYDEQSGLLFDPCGITYPKVREEPTRENAIRALKELKSVYQTFPFVDAASRSVVLAACLTAVTRRSLRAAPMFGFSAPKPGSGKSLLAESISYLATGRSPSS